MNREEQIASEFLHNLNEGKVIFEPNGFSKSPDFSLNARIGIEVRRLNKQVNLGDEIHPIEEARYPFLRKFDKLLSDLDNPDLEFSIGVYISFKRPIVLGNMLVKKIKESIRNSTLSEEFGLPILVNENIKYKLIKGNGRSDTTYFRYITKDMDQGGNVQDSRILALQVAIHEKESKMRAVKNDYSEIWLILIDEIFSCVDYTFKQDLQRYEEIKSSFNRIIVISARDRKSWIDIYPWNEYKNN
jgi:hypothetical protein